MSDITRVTRPELTGLRRPRYNARPYTNVVPLTFRDATTLTEQTEAIKEWITRTLIPHVDLTNAELAESWEKTVNQIVDAFINSTVELQDIVFAELIVDGDSLTHAAMDEFVNNIIVEKEDDPGVFAIRPPVRPELIGVRPDPNDPGFFG